MQINILGITYNVQEVECVNRTDPELGEVNFLTNEIRIDKALPQDLKEQTLMHEILHAIFNLLGMYDLCEDESKVQSLVTALHQVFKTQPIFS